MKNLCWMDVVKSAPEGDSRCVQVAGPAGMTAEKCRVCSSPLAVRAGPGRPRSYCGPLCRRAAEYEIRRVQSLLLRAERMLQDVRLNSDLNYWRTPDERGHECSRLEAEVQLLQARLVGILAGLAPEE